MTKERPVLFSAPMVRAILAGVKTQTRRIVKGAPDDWCPIGPDVFSPTIVDRHGEERPGPDSYGAGNEDGDCWIRCPYGQPGDRLWVRETWMPDPPIDDTWASTQWHWCRDGQIAGVPERFRHPRFCNYAADWLYGAVIWTPSIHMPRWASRITLDITSIRVERLQEISEVDSIDEGVLSMGQQWEVDTFADYFEAFGVAVSNGEKPPLGPSPRKRYAKLWEQINGPGSWDANPWVWVVSFTRVAQAA